MDHVADLCQRTDVYWQLASEMTAWWQRRMEHRWKRNPYNSENGGPSVLPSDYFTNAAAKDFIRCRLRCSVARWGWASNLVARELWNEVDSYDTATGRVLRRDNGSVNHLNHFGYGLELRPPDFWGDIAARVIRRGRQW